MTPPLSKKVRAQAWAQRGVGVLILMASFLAFARWQRPADQLNARVLNYVRCRDKVVALTFDDGPHPLTTALLLDVLHRYDVHATFLLVGTKAAEAPDLVRRMRADGHDVESHTYSHDNLNKLSDNEIRHEIAFADRDISAAISVHPWMVRPPGGEYNLRTMRIFNRMGRAFALWSLNPGDWRKPPPKAISDYVLRNVRPGEIVLLHDDALNTVDALPVILDGLKKRGYQLVTMSELELIR